MRSTGHYLALKSQLRDERDDHFGPATAERLAARDIPGATGVPYLPDSAHLPMLEQPVEYANVALRFPEGMGA